MRQTALDQVYELAKRDQRVVFVGSDLGVGTLKKFKAEMPDRFFMEGVAEQNIIGMAAGLAMEGFIPYVNTIATFLTRRCYEQVAVDLCLHKLPVRLLASGGGVVYAPLGPTHLAIEDMAILRALPNMTVIAPVDAEEMTRLIPATLDYPGPVYVRFGKGGDPVVSKAAHGFAIGTAITLKPAGRVGMISTGVMSERCLRAAGLLAESGIEAGVLHCHTVKPLDVAAIADLAAQVDLLVTVEEHVLTAGLGSAVLEALADRGGRLSRILRLALPDSFTRTYGSQDSMLELYGLHPEGIAASVLGRLNQT
ncbi:putative transketolase C-terminal section [Paramagnetospirillum caucaseum]|uniref:Putative transketolase C-terminal section n=1 Tax=Paramagnetospirillum caucaseum TaxID=1244869 RepID=M2ZT63_9PROT|nr:transketolase C-terminal domain-containing protein [Paramagnetospirillum caucaseum]EME70547.1 putative transketolase C-terminal section [Paramagnetospirillum caucaseum]